MRAMRVGMFPLLALLLVTLLLVGCGARTSKTEDVIHGTITSVTPAPDPPTIVCWGDSLTAGVGASEAYIETRNTSYDASFLPYPQMLADMTGLVTYNMGVPGATSDEIVAMQGNLEPPEGLEMEHFNYDVAAQAVWCRGDILVLEMGSNGGWNGDYNTLIGQYYTMIARSGCKDYLIIGDTDDPGTSVADTHQEPFEAGSGIGRTRWEAALRAEFGDHFINMRRYLIKYGLKVAGLEETPEDAELAQRGCVSPQLRSDWTHLNSYGYYVQARAIYRRGVKLGLWK